MLGGDSQLRDIKFVLHGDNVHGFPPHPPPVFGLHGDDDVDTDDDEDSNDASKD